MKGAIYYVPIATVTFSHVKITCYFHKGRYQVFARKLTWYFIGVYIIIMGSLCSMYGQTLSPPVSHVVFDKQDVQQ